MEIIELSSYTENEKFHIAENYLVKKQRKLSGLTKKQVSISDEVIREVIHFYTREAGVRNLERTIGQLMHKAARKIVEGEEKVDIKKKSLKELLGPAPFEDEDENLKPQIGVVRGLAWTSVCLLYTSNAEGGYLFTYKRENPGEGDNYFVDVYRFVMDIDENDVSFQEAEIDGYMFATKEQIEGFAAEGKFLHYDSIKQAFSFEK